MVPSVVSATSGLTCVCRDAVVNGQTVSPSSGSTGIGVDGCKYQIPADPTKEMSKDGIHVARTKTKKFNEAVSICSKLDMNLAIPRNNAQNRLYRDQADTYHRAPFWVGITKASGDWTNVYSGQSQNYFNWGPDNTGDGNHAGVDKNGDWNTLDDEADGLQVVCTYSEGSSSQL